MNLLSAPVLGSAAVLTSPALWAAFVTHEMPVDVALLRFLVAAVLAWLALSAFAFLVRPPRTPRPAPQAEIDVVPRDDGRP